MALLLLSPWDFTTNILGYTFSITPLYFSILFRPFCISIYTFSPFRAFMFSITSFMLSLTFLTQFLLSQNYAQAKLFLNIIKARLNPRLNYFFFLDIISSPKSSSSSSSLSSSSSSSKSSSSI